MNETRRGFLAKIGLGVLALVGGAKLAEAKPEGNLVETFAPEPVAPTGFVPVEVKTVDEIRAMYPSATSTPTVDMGGSSYTTSSVQTHGSCGAVAWQAQTPTGAWVEVQAGDRIDGYTRLRHKVTMLAEQQKVVAEEMRAAGFKVVTTGFVPRPEDDEEARFWASDEGERAVATLTGMGM